MNISSSVMSEPEIKAKICEYGSRLYARGLVAGNEGNISCRFSHNEVWMTPTMESKGYMSPDMLVKLDLDGNKIGGELDASSESRMHLGIYKARPDITAIVHAHPPIATALAGCGKNIPTTSWAEPVLLFGKELVVTPFATPGTEDVPNSVLPYLGDRNALLLGNHGALTWARTLKEAYFLMETLEQFCTTYLVSEKLLGGAAPLSAPDVETMLALRNKR